MKIAQCWDDGVEDDIRLVEILRRHGAKASFNLNMGLHGPERSHPWVHRGKTVRRLTLSELAPLYEGFLVANHTLNHPHLTRLPLEEARREIAAGREALEQHFGYAVTGFAYPFGDYNGAVADIIRETGHVYARTTAAVDHLPEQTEPMTFGANGHFLAPNFWERFENARADGVFYFWGHSYELLTEEDWAAFEEKIKRLSAEGEWVALPDLFPA